MLYRETGILSGSHYYFFSPSETAEQFFYYMVWAGHSFCQFGYAKRRDTYPYLLLVYVRKGEMILDYEQRHHVVRAGEVFLIDCLFPHHYCSTDGLEFMYFHFDGLNAHALCQMIIAQNGGPIFKTKHNRTVEKLIDYTVTRYLNNQVISDAETSRIIYDAVCCLAFDAELPPAESTPIADAMRYIRGHADQKLSLHEIADFVHLSPYYFAHLFKREVGYSPLEFAARLRIDMAKMLLKTTKNSVESIAFQVGYSSSASFSNAFTLRIGVSPRQFRNMPIS